MKKIFVITHQDDPHVSLVEKHSNGLEFIRYATDNVHLISGRTRLGTTTLTYNDIPAQADVVWYRKPVTEDRFFAPRTPELNEFISQEIARSISWLALSAFADKPWVSDPGHIQRAANRCLQLDFARHCELMAPDTLITNSPEDAIAFCESHQWQVVGKTLGTPVVRVEGVVKNPLARRITENQRDQLKHIKFCPTVLQALIATESEYRVTVFGEHVFPFRIIRSNPNLGLDWKADEKLTVEPGVIPRRIKLACIDLVKKFNLSFSTMDIIQDKRGQYFMIDLNPNGQWAWLDEQNEYGLISAFADYLKKL